MQTKITRRVFTSRMIRSYFFSSLLFLSGSVLSYPKTFQVYDKYQNMFRHNGRPLLIVIRGNDLVELMTKGLSRLLKSSNIAPKKDKVFIQPNANSNEPYPVATDVQFLNASTNFLKDIGNNGILVGDNPFYKETYIIKDQEHSNLKRENINVFTDDPGIGYSYCTVYNKDWLSNTAILVNKEMINADLVINMAITKHHPEADFAYVLIDNFGSASNKVRAQTHLRTETNNKNGPTFFDRIIVEIADAFRPQITIVDVRSILTKSGPSFHSENVVHNDGKKIIISGNMSVIGAYCSKLLENHDPTFRIEKIVNYQINYAERIGLGVADLLQVELIEYNPLNPTIYNNMRT